MKMKLMKQVIFIAIIITLMTSCASSKIVLSHNANIDKYKYVVFGKETSGDRELDDVVMEVQNQIAETKVRIKSEIRKNGVKVLGYRLFEETA